MEKNIDEVMKELIRQLSNEQSVDLLGKPMNINDDINVIPLLKTSLVFGEINSHLPFDKKIIKKNDLLFEASSDLYPRGKGNLGNIKTEPCALLIINKGEVKFIRMEEHNPFLKILEITKDIFIKKKK